MTESERMMKWLRDNPKKAQALKERERAKKIARQDESIAAWNKARYKSPVFAIRAFCNACPIGVSRCGFDRAPVSCEKTACPLYCFRNGDPRKIAQGRKENNIAVVHAPNT